MQLKCEYCGYTFDYQYPDSNKTGGRKPKFCSDECRRKAKNKKKREAYKNNPKKYVENALEWRKNNPEKAAKIQKRYAEKHQEQIKQHQRKCSKKRWKENSDRIREIRDKWAIKKYGMTFNEYQRWRKQVRKGKA